MAGQVIRQDQTHRPYDRKTALFAFIAIDLLLLATVGTQSEVLARLFPTAFGVILLIWGGFAHEYAAAGAGCTSVGIGLGVLIVPQGLSFQGYLLDPAVLLGLTAGLFAAAYFAPWFERTGLWPRRLAIVFGVIGLVRLIMAADPRIGALTVDLLTAVANGLAALLVFWPVIFGLICVVAFLWIRSRMDPKRS